MKNLMSLLLSLILVALCAGVALAADDECETDADCPNGFVCVETEVGTDDWTVDVEEVPAADAGDSTDPEADDDGDEEGDEAAPIEEPPAETYKYCDAKPCEADADCDGDTVCVVIEIEECLGVVVGDSTSTPASDDSAGSDDFAPEPEPTEPEEEEEEGKEDPTGEGEGESEGEECETFSLPGFCGPKWLAPCEADADCGDGNFTCVEAETCWSSGSTGSGSSAGFAPDPDSPGDETDPSEEGSEGKEGADEGEAKMEAAEENCEGTGYFYCEMAEIPCTDNADCPADWTCLENPEAAVSVSMDAPCDIDDEGNEDCPEQTGAPEPTADISSLCFPPGYEDYSNWGGPEASVGVGETDVANTGATGPKDDDGEDEEAADSAGGSSSGDDGGCAGAPQPLSAAWLALALFALVVLRRRARTQS